MNGPIQLADFQVLCWGKKKKLNFIFLNLKLFFIISILSLLPESSEIILL